MNKNQKRKEAIMKPPVEKGKFPARLHVLLARESKIGLVIRRGPSKSVCTVLWKREGDKFKLGQWMKGRIYERRCDLSPDGKYFIYFAMNFARRNAEAKGSWTAISQVPYLKAMGLFAKGDCWNGGGLFLSNREFWLNDDGMHEELRKPGKLRRNMKGPDEYFGGECLTVYYNRLQRDGWVMHKEEYQGATLFEKKLPRSWRLRKLAYAETGAPPGRGCYWDAHELYRESSQTFLAFPEWEWADYVDGRLVFAVDGQLWSAQLGKGRLTGEKLLKDFNDMKFERLVGM
jgi:hypothetical protein